MERSRGALNATTCAHEPEPPAESHAQIGEAGRGGDSEAGRSEANWIWLTGRSTRLDAAMMEPWRWERNQGACGGRMVGRKGVHMLKSLRFIFFV